MAISVVETRVANPARKGKKRNMARKLSAKQIKYFGTKRQRAALKTKRKNAAKKAYHRPAKKRANPAPRRAKKYVSKKRTSHRKAAKRKNPVPEIISFVMGNPGSKRKGRKKTMASSKKYKKTASRKNAGRRSTKKVYKSKRRTRNPAGLGRPMDWIKGGVGVIGGGVGTRVIPQFLGTTNTGAMGYALNGITAIALAWGTHAFTKDAVLTASVAAGGFAALILRIVGDLTPYGQALSLSGFGDYMVSNFVAPQRLVDPRKALMEVPGNGWGGVYPSPVPMSIGGASSGSDVGGYAGSGNAY